MDIADAVQVLNYLFLEGAAPPEPFSACGVDPTPENPSLGCAEASCGS
jgi:hypothetical protein